MAKVILTIGETLIIQMALKRAASAFKHNILPSFASLGGELNHAAQSITAAMEAYILATARYVQIKNPRTGNYTRIDRKLGKITSHRKTRFKIPEVIIESNKSKQNRIKKALDDTFRIPKDIAEDVKSSKISSGDMIRCIHENKPNE